MKIFLSVVLLLLSLLSLFAWIDDSAMAIYDETFERAVYSFALAKALNAIVSVLQSSEVSANFIVGATVGVGEILDPINDLVERFSWIMLASSVSIGIQHLLLVLGKSLFVKVALGAGVLFTLFSMWIKKFQFPSAFIFGLKVTFLLLVLRFAAIVFIYSTQLLYNEVYSEQYNSATEFISEYKTELEVMQKNKKELDGYWSKFEDKMELFSRKVIKLITIFVVTTVLFPLLFLWFFLFLIKSIYNLKMDSDKIAVILNKKEKA